MAGIRAPLFIQKGQYDAQDFRAALADVRGLNIGVIPGSAGDGLKVTAVSGNSARVAVAPGRAWIPLTKNGTRDSRGAYYVDLPAPGIQFDLATASATADRYDLIIARVTNETDATPYSEVPLGNFAPGNLAAGWTVDVVRGVDGSGAPTVPFENCILLAKIRVRRGALVLAPSDIEDMRFTSSQGDPTPLSPLRTAPGQSVASVAAQQNRGGLIYNTDEDRLYVKGATSARPLSAGISLHTAPTSRGATGWWGADQPNGGNGRMMTFDGAATSYDRVGIVSYQMRYTTSAGRSGWTSCWVMSGGILQWDGIRVNTGGSGAHVGVTHVWISKNQPLAVHLYLYSQGGVHQYDDWQSTAQMTIIPVE
ncbi:hypothetical protein ACFRMQ_09535 [Kitasatospora sp. NPDC056783]|uniref:hypothetical protein n=1 Tax=Kitasatospora sp. NPDC056783 TaxID=3345943 RepID=UPI0036A2F5CD